MLVDQRLLDGLSWRDRLCRDLRGKRGISGFSVCEFESSFCDALRGL